MIVSAKLGVEEPPVYMNGDECVCNYVFMYICVHIGGVEKAGVYFLCFYLL